MQPVINNTKICHHKAGFVYMCDDAKLLQYTDRNFHYHCPDCLKSVKFKTPLQIGIVPTYYPAKSHKDVLVWIREEK